MRHALCLSMVVLLGQPGLADTVYKCQNGGQTVYSQSPCAHAQPLELSDTRSPEQREQAQAAAQAQSKAADALESQRLAREAKETKRLADQQAAAEKAARAAAKVSEPQVVQPIIVVRPAPHHAPYRPPPVEPPKPYCHLSALRC